MTNTRDLILEMKKVQKEHNYSYNDMAKLMEANGDRPLSPATFSRIFADGSEDNASFSYDYTLVPLARAILDMDVEPDDAEDVKVLKEMLKIKHARVKELELENESLHEEISQQALNHHKKMDDERASWLQSIEFLKEQIVYKDARMNEFSGRINRLLDRLEKKDARIEQLTDDILALKDIKERMEMCPYRKGNNE